MKLLSFSFLHISFIFHFLFIKTFLLIVLAQLGELLGGANETDIELLTSFTRLLNFKGETFEQSIRKYLTKFQLPGEAQTISRVMGMLEDC
jgi:Sec7-like guanine-nucleotide exchange factor